MSTIATQLYNALRARFGTDGLDTPDGPGPFTIAGPVIMENFLEGTILPLLSPADRAHADALAEKGHANAYLTFLGERVPDMVERFSAFLHNEHSS